MTQNKLLEILRSGEDEMRMLAICILFGQSEAYILEFFEKYGDPKKYYSSVLDRWDLLAPPIPTKGPRSVFMVSTRLNNLIISYSNDSVEVWRYNSNYKPDFDGPAFLKID